MRLYCPKRKPISRAPTIPGSKKCEPARQQARAPCVRGHSSKCSAQLPIAHPRQCPQRARRCVRLQGRGQAGVGCWAAVCHKTLPRSCALCSFGCGRRQGAQARSSSAPMWRYSSVMNDWQNLGEAGRRQVEEVRRGSGQWAPLRPAGQQPRHLSPPLDFCIALVCRQTKGDRLRRPVTAVEGHQDTRAGPLQAAMLQVRRRHPPLGLKSEPPLPAPMGSVVRAFLNICNFLGWVGGPAW